MLSDNSLYTIPPVGINAATYAVYSRTQMLWRKWMFRIRIAVLVATLTLLGCGDGLNKGTFGKLGIVFSPSSPLSGNTYALTPLDPELPFDQKVLLEMVNEGTKDLTITDVYLLPTNEHGEKTAKNPWVNLQSVSATTLPFTIPAKDFSVSLDYNVVYDPEDGNRDDTTLRIESSAGTHDYIFTLSDCAPQVRVDPPSDTFFNATVTKPEEKIFQIHNDGNCPLVFDRIEESQATSVFTLVEAPITGAEVLPKGDPNYAPLLFKVRYQPNSASAKDSISYEVYTSDDAHYPVNVPLTTQSEGGSFIVTYGTQASGFLDFTDTSAGNKTITVNIYNEGPAVFTLTKATMVGDESGSHYSTTMEKPAPMGEFPEPVTTLPLALAQGKSVDIHVTYNAATIAGMNAQLEIQYTQPDYSTFTIPAYGGDPKPCFEMSPGDATSPVGVQFVGEGGEAVSQNVVIYNCGNAPLSITDIRIEDDFFPDQPSTIWTLTDPGSPAFNIAVGALQVLALEMNAPENEIKAGGTLYIDYVDTGGATVTFTGIDLQGVLNAADTTLPTAVTGTYTGALTGQTLALDASGSTPGSEGLYEKGYLWYLLARPAGSQVILNGAPGMPNRTIIPDKAGTYTFGLRVHGNSGSFLYSDEATVDVVVQ